MKLVKKIISLALSSVMAGAVMAPVGAIAEERNSQFSAKYAYVQIDPAPENCDLIVTGASFRSGDAEPRGYYLRMVNPDYAFWDVLWYVDAAAIPEEQIQLGDLFAYDGTLEYDFEEFTTEVPLDYRLCTYQGNAAKLYGEAVMPILQQTLLTDEVVYSEEQSRFVHTAYRHADHRASAFFETLTVCYGDVDCDQTVDLMDVIAVNKAIFGTRTLQGYSRIVADTNDDDILDETDSLNLLKCVVGLIPASELPVQ